MTFQLPRTDLGHAFLEAAEGAPKPSSKKKMPANVNAIARKIGMALQHYRVKRAAPDRLQRCLKLIKGQGPAPVVAMLESLPPAWSDHAIASIYALLMPAKQRQNLGAYFTPPHLVDHLVTQMRRQGANLVEDRIRDPAAGGAAFLVPLARLKVAAWRKNGHSDAVVVQRLQQHLIGHEIENDLAILANALIRRMLIKEFKIARSLAAKVRLVRTGDSLNARTTQRDRVDHEVGNPPFLRLRGNDSRARDFAEMSTGRLNLYAIFVRRALAEVPGNGLVAYVIPASFLGGPEFERFRRRVLQLAKVLVIDQIAKRRDVFLDATQDACFIVLRRRRKDVQEPSAVQACSGVLHRDGRYVSRGTAHIAPDGAAWRLPGPTRRQSAILKDWGYRATIGYLVANRQPKRLHEKRGKGKYPLVWAKSITTVGRFDFARGAAFKGWGWADAPPDAPYLIRKPCVVVQRTSSRGQKRRLNAAPIFRSFLDKHGGIIGENHVIILVPLSADAVSPRALAAALNQTHASAQLDRVCGSASISARLLEKLPIDLPPRRKGR